MSDLIQTEHVPSSWLALPSKKNIKPEKYTNITLANTNKHTRPSCEVACTYIKTKKCQPANGDIPDLIQTEHVPSSWLARPTKKNIKSDKHTNGTLASINKHTRSSCEVA